MSHGGPLGERPPEASTRSYDIDSALLLAYPPEIPGAYISGGMRERRAARLIVAGQLLERFMYVGTYALLPVYLTRYPLMMTNATAVIEIHAFGATTYGIAFVTGLFVAAGIALYTWSVWFAVLGVLGCATVCASSVVTSLQQAGRVEYPAEVTTAMVAALGALLMISTASGGLRATLPVLGSWQFGAGPPRTAHSSTPVLASVRHRHAHRRAGRFFMHMWYAENAAYATAVILVPWTSLHIACLGADTCYPLSYGLTAAAGALCVLLFVAGRRWLVRPRPQWRAPALAGDPVPLANFEAFEQKMLDDEDDAADAVESPSEIEVRVETRKESAVQLLLTSFREFRAYVRLRGRNAGGGADDDASSVDAALARLTPEFRRGCEAVLRALKIMAPAALFWALYHQQATMWVFQATLMGCTLRMPRPIVRIAPWAAFSVQVQPEQTIVARPLFAIAMLPVVAGGVLPALRWVRGGRVPRPSTLMIAGLLLATCAFALSAVLQGYILNHLRGTHPYHGQMRWDRTHVSVLLQLPQYALMAAAEILFEPASIEYAMYGDSTSAARDLHGVRDARLFAVGFSSWEAAMCAGQLLVVLVVLLGRALGISLAPRELLYMLTAWAFAVLMSAFVLLLLVTRHR